MGGDMDGMGDLDNAPMPPMGPDDMGGEDPMGGAPDDMGGEPPMDGPMGGEDPMMGGEMPMESKRGMKSIIDEVLNDVLDSQEGTKRPEKKMPRQYRNMEMPFKSPF